jgi:hypothetical protein
MAGARGRSGGRRTGAGRPFGSVGGRKRGALNITTREAKSLYQQHTAAKARALYSRDPRSITKPSEVDADAAVSLVVDILTALAIKGDARAAIQLDERLHGRIPYQVGGTDETPPIQIHHGGEIPAYKVVPPRRRPRTR